MSYNDHYELEVRDRVRRIETRLTVLAKGLGIDVGGAAIVWSAETKRVQVSTPNCSLAEIMRAVPLDRQGHHVDIYLGCQYLATVFADSARSPLLPLASSGMDIATC